MKEQLQRILDLQAQYQAMPSPAMDERGQLIRNMVPFELRERESDLGTAMGVKDLLSKVEMAPA